MARCGCSGGGCNCTIIDGPGISVEGTGTDESPYVISYDEVAQAVKTVSANYTMTDKDRLLLVQGTHTIKLPPAASAQGRLLTIKNIGTGSVTVSGNGTNIDGTATKTLPAQWDRISVISSGSHWYKIAGS